MRSQSVHFLRSDLLFFVALAILFSLANFKALAAKDLFLSPHPLASDEIFKAKILPLVQKYCLNCHSDDDPNGDFSLELLDRPSQVLEDRELWVKAYKQLWIKSMPPADKTKRPTAAEYDLLVEWLDMKLYHCDCAKVDDVGRKTIHRLNRIEYNNTIRDLLGVDISPADDFPSDDVGYGFSNMADVLSLPPLLLEKYVNAAEKISALVVLPKPLDERRFTDRQLKTDGGAKSAGGGWLLLTSTGSVYHDHVFQQSGEYFVRVEAMADQAGPEVAKMLVSVDKKKTNVFEVEGHLKPATYEIRYSFTKGSHRLAGTFINDYYNPSAKNPRERDRNLSIRSIAVIGPVDTVLPSSYKQIVISTPNDKKPVLQAAREIFTHLLPRAFRRPVSDAEVNRFATLVESVTKQGEPFERGIQVGLQAMLVSPHFLFRVEMDPQSNDPKAQRLLTDFELASRLSYFLWSTMPDDELFELAADGKLHQSDVLDKQITRMLKDPKADALVDNFASQWLNLSNLVEVVPDAKLFPEFTPQLRADMIAETKLFIRTVFREDRSLLDFLDAKTTFVNERLARHYGIDGVKGDKMRLVSLPPKQRAGILTHGSILTLTSNPDRTSLVRRGNWIVHNVLGLPLPEPPNDITPLEQGAKESGASTLREQLALHRASANCAPCHNTLDPLGFGMENFDAIGRWREKGKEGVIESGGVMPDGESFSGPVELIGILKKRQDKFVELVTRKMLTYALGRGLEIPDSCTVDDIVADLKENDFRFTRLVRGVIHSRPFLMRRGE